MKQLTTRLLYDYWNDVRGDRLAPTRFEIEPARMSTVLSETFILERTLREGFPFRLAGTRICEQFGRELRGSDFLSLIGSDHRAISLALSAVTNAGAALLLEIEAETADSRTAQFEALVLPLKHPAEEVTRYLGTISAMDPEPWLGFEPLERSWLIRHNLIWPDGCPDALTTNLDRRLPFSPELAAARIVRSDRRQFRILDGGRKE
ncbi:MAG: PAS domain-containing protein [Hyphomicrobiaceae bacterium]